MAGLYIQPKLRICIVDGKKALFHCWNQQSEIYAPSLLKGGHNGGVVAYTSGIVEFEDGEVRCVSPEKITFIDGDSYFKDYDWTTEKGEENE